MTPLPRLRALLAAALAAVSCAAASAQLVFSAYKDTAVAFDWSRDIARTRVSGALQALGDDLAAHGESTITLAFANGECGTENWTGADGAKVAKANRHRLENAGRRVIVSTGGYGAKFTCASDNGMETFIRRWNGANLVGLDFDIEWDQTQAEVDDLVARVRAAHVRHPRLRFSFTVGTNAPTAVGSHVAVAGLGHGAAEADAFDPLYDYGHAVMSALRSQLGWDGSAADWPSYVTMNLMAMDYGLHGHPWRCVAAKGRCLMGESAVQAAWDLESAWNVPVGAIELTAMIGRNDSPDEEFTLDDVDRVSAFALGAGLAGVHHWSYDRDVPCDKKPASDVCNSMGPWTARYGYLQRFLADGLQ